MSRLEEEYREFVGSRAASLHRTAYLLCGDWHLADDLVQETFVQTFRHWRRVQRAGNQNAYVKRILINEFKRHWQRYSGLPVRADLDRLEFAVPDVSNEVVNRADLLGALLTLPARQRATVVLRYLEGMSERETAAVLRCSEGGAPPAPRTAGAPPARTGAPTSPAGSAATRQPLVKLAADLVTEASPAGDATLVERETGAPGKASTNVWDLYTDDGRYFFSPTEAGLPPQVSKANPKAATGPAYQEAITINASTGIPLGFAGGSAGHVAATVTYVVTRVSLAGIAAGQF
ncbi:MAG TPA: sigma-70 family RNA polymerase sigma factor [Trebonia sp.]